MAIVTRDGFESIAFKTTFNNLVKIRYPETSLLGAVVPLTEVTRALAQTNFTKYRSGSVSSYLILRQRTYTAHAYAAKLPSLNPISSGGSTAPSGRTALSITISPIRSNIEIIVSHFSFISEPIGSSQSKSTSGPNNSRRCIFRMIKIGQINPIGSYCLFTSPSSILFVKLILIKRGMSSSVMSHS